jgi:hypothetical protein
MNAPDDYALPFWGAEEQEGPESLLGAAIRAEEARREAFDLSMIEYERGLDFWEEEPVTEPDGDEPVETAAEGCVFCFMPGL